jgi:hypothetical protein
VAATVGGAGMSDHGFVLFLIMLACMSSCSKLERIADGVERMSPPPPEQSSFSLTLEPATK